jgi:hypothetical protein
MKQAYRRRASIWDWFLLTVVLPLCLLALAIAEVTR